MLYEEFEKKMEAIKVFDPKLHAVLSVAWEDLLWRSRRGLAQTPSYQEVLDLVIADIEAKEFRTEATEGDRPVPQKQ